MKMIKNNHIVLTTIYKPNVLIELQKNISQYGHLDDVVCWVVGDKKTPVSCKELCKKITKKGLEANYLGIEEQDKWGKKFPKFYAKLPYDNETRRNIGYLFALENGCKRLISIDDDNFPTSDDFIHCHSRTGSRWKGKIIKNANGYYNICEHLSIKPNRLIFPRGFPFELRGHKNIPQSIRLRQDILIGINSGLWLKEPDVDATTWLNGKIESIAYQGPSSFVLHRDTWSPINTQNTSVIRELIPAFLCVPMGFKLPGGHIERYGDIWSGYFIQSIIQGTPYHVCFGRPIVEHRRNQHSYLNDLRNEYWGMILTDWLLQQLRDRFEPTSSDIVERVMELSSFLSDVCSNNLPAWCPSRVRLFMKKTARTLFLWAKVCKQIMR